MITFLLRELDKTLGLPENLQYLHVSIQPEEDTAKEILSHFDDHGIDAAHDRRWLFVNGPADGIRQFLDHTDIQITRTPGTAASSSSTRFACGSWDRMGGR